MLTDDLRKSYLNLFDSCFTLGAHKNDVDKFVSTLMRGFDQYTQVEHTTGVPFYVTGLIHGLEGSFNFNTHLHNGDPLTARTVHVPRGRPPQGSPPFAWTFSAVDALEFDHLAGSTDWTIAGICYKLEGFNGFGYRQHHINSPYLWSFSNNYERGKYTADGVWDSNAVSKQCGAITALKAMATQNLVTLKR